MCSVSMIMDHYSDKWAKVLRDGREPVPAFPPPSGIVGDIVPISTAVPIYPVPLTPVPETPMITREEIEEFRQLLERDREYDRRNNEPDCELAEKRERVKKIAEELGVEIAFI